MQWIALVAVLGVLIGWVTVARPGFRLWLWVWLAVLAAGAASGLTAPLGAWVLVAALLWPALLLNIAPLRRHLISAPLLQRVRKILPTILSTEQEEQEQEVAFGRLVA